MALQIQPNAIAKSFLAEILLEHAQHGRTLLIGQDVEHPGGFFRALDRKLNRARALESVDLHGRGARHRETVPASPFGLPRIDREHFHEGGKCFVQPKAIPPFHRDQIAEPHVRVLVRHYVRHPLELGARGFLAIDQQRGFAKRDCAQVFHRSRGEIGNGDQIQLVSGIGNAVIAAEMFQRSLADVDGEAAKMLFSGHRAYPERRLASHDGLGRFKFPDDKTDQIGRHLYRVGKYDPLFTAFGHSRFANDPRVRDRGELLIDDQRDLVDCLECRLIPTRESAASVGRFELGRSKALFQPAFILVSTAIKTMQLVIENA